MVNKKRIYAPCINKDIYEVWIPFEASDRIENSLKKYRNVFEKSLSVWIVAETTFVSLLKMERYEFFCQVN